MVISMAWGVFYALTQSIPLIFQQLYGFGTGRVGLVYLSMSPHAIEIHRLKKSTIGSVTRSPINRPESQNGYDIPATIRFWYRSRGSRLPLHVVSCPSFAFRVRCSSNRSALVPFCHSYSTSTKNTCTPTRPVPKPYSCWNIRGILCVRA
jgi:hypothetical protein